MNRRKLLTLLLSLFIHLLLFISLWTLLPKEKKELNSSGTKKIQLSLSDFVIPKPKKQIQKTKPIKPKIKNKPKPKKVPVAPKKPTTKQKPKKIVKSEHKTSKEVNSTSKNSDFLLFAKALSETIVVEEPTLQPPLIEQINNNFTQREFYALYKDEFAHFSSNQKKFIKNSLAKIQGITQHYLTIRGYPYFAGRMRQQGTNVVEFYLLPNGDIIDLKIITPTGYEELDQNSLDTIKTAYKDYPRPKEKTKIRFYINYSIY